MLKLKSLLNEGFAWERKDGKPLPTLAEVQAEYEKNLREETEYKVAGRPVTLNKNGSEEQTKWTVTFENGKTELYTSVMTLMNKRPKLQNPWWNSDGDDKPYEKGDDVNEIAEGRKDLGILDLVSDAMGILDKLYDDMSTNSAVQRNEKREYLDAYNEVLGILADIRKQADGME